MIASRIQSLEAIIADLHTAAADGEKKPRTYKNRARKEYLRFARNRKPTIKVIRKAIKKQLGYVRRDLAIAERLLEVGGRLTEKQQNRLVTIKKVYAQQDEMYREKKHKVEDRIVSISQSWVRLIVRGKANAPVEFGAKVSISMVDGFACCSHRTPFLGCVQEGTTLQETAERYRFDTGFYPERILVNKIYRTR